MDLSSCISVQAATSFLNFEIGGTSSKPSRTEAVWIRGAVLCLLRPLQRYHSVWHEQAPQPDPQTLSICHWMTCRILVHSGSCSVGVTDYTGSYRQFPLLPRRKSSYIHGRTCLIPSASQHRTSRKKRRSVEILLMLNAGMLNAPLCGEQRGKYIAAHCGRS